jgi:hypothetical protein
MKVTPLLPAAFLAIATIGVPKPTPATANSADCSVFQSQEKSCARHDRADRKAAAKSSAAKPTEKRLQAAEKASNAAQKANKLEKRATKAAAAAEAES